MSRLPFLGDYANGKPAVIDLPRLLETRMLIQSASGFGKSWAVRRLLEITAGQVQQLVIDPDGEYATLRERHDFVIAAAHDGDALAHPKTAALLARRLLETGVSAILDIYDLKPHERHAFVRIFLQALVDAPKALWRPVLTVVDEAHVYCPQVGESEAAGAVIDLATRGRKRGFGIVLATQRLSKLNKDAAAECLNKLIGRAGLDLDVKRAADDLGMTHREASEQLKKLEPGEFFAYGPALCPDVQRVKVGEVRTTHPKAGERSLVAPPKPTAAIKAVLPQLADLPKEAEQEARTVEDLRRELNVMRHEVNRAKLEKLGPSAEDLKTAKDAGYYAGFAEGRTATRRAIAMVLPDLRDELIRATQSTFAVATKGLNDALNEKTQSRSTPRAPSPSLGKTAAPVQRPAPRSGSGDSSVIGNKGARRSIMIALAQHGPMLPGRLGMLAGVSTKGGSWSTWLSSLRVAGFIEDASGTVSVTEAGIEALGGFEPLPTGDQRVDYWRRRVGNGARLQIFNALIDCYPDAMSQSELAERAGVSCDGGSWSTWLSGLRTMGLITGTKELRAAEELFT